MEVNLESSPVYKKGGGGEGEGGVCSTFELGIHGSYGKPSLFLYDIRKTRHSWLED